MDFQAPAFRAGLETTPAFRAGLETNISQTTSGFTGAGVIRCTQSLYHGQESKFSAPEPLACGRLAGDGEALAIDDPLEVLQAQVPDYAEFKAWLQQHVKGAHVSDEKKQKLHPTVMTDCMYDQVRTFLKSDSQKGAKGQAGDAKFRHSVRKKKYHLVTAPELGLYDAVFTLNEEGRPRRVVPLGQIVAVLYEVHVLQTKHGGIRKTHRSLSEHYVGIPEKVVRQFLLMCTQCTRQGLVEEPTLSAPRSDAQQDSVSRGPHSHDSSALKHAQALSSVWHAMQIHLLDMNSSPDGDKCWIVHAKDLGSRFSLLGALSTSDAASVATQLLTWLTTIGPPAFISPGTGVDSIELSAILERLHASWPELRLQLSEAAAEPSQSTSAEEEEAGEAEGGADKKSSMIGASMGRDVANPEAAPEKVKPPLPKLPDADGLQAQLSEWADATGRRDWVAALPVIQWKMNTKSDSVSGSSPFNLAMGRVPLPDSEEVDAELVDDEVVTAPAVKAWSGGAMHPEATATAVSSHGMKRKDTNDEGSVGPAGSSPVTSRPKSAGSSQRPQKAPKNTAAQSTPSPLSSLRGGLATPSRVPGVLSMVTSGAKLYAQPFHSSNSPFLATALPQALSQTPNFQALSSTISQPLQAPQSQLQRRIMEVLSASQGATPVTDSVPVLNSALDPAAQNSRLGGSARGRFSTSVGGDLVTGMENLRSGSGVVSGVTLVEEVESGLGAQGRFGTDVGQDAELPGNAAKYGYGSGEGWPARTWAGVEGGTTAAAAGGGGGYGTDQGSQTPMGVEGESWFGKTLPPQGGGLGPETEAPSVVVSAGEESGPARWMAMLDRSVNGVSWAGLASQLGTDTGADFKSSGLNNHLSGYDNFPAALPLGTTAPLGGGEGEFSPALALGLLGGSRSHSGLDDSTMGSGLTRSGPGLAPNLYCDLGLPAPSGNAMADELGVGMLQCGSFEQPTPGMSTGDRLGEQRRETQAHFSSLGLGLGFPRNASNSVNGASVMEMFLDFAGLSQFGGLLGDAWVDMAELAGMSDEDLAAIGLPTGACKKLRRALSRWQNDV